MCNVFSQNSTNTYAVNWFKFMTKYMNRIKYSDLMLFCFLMKHVDLQAMSLPSMLVSSVSLTSNTEKHYVDYIYSEEDTREQIISYF